MEKTRTSTGQLLFLALLSVLPLAIIWADGALRRGFALEQRRQAWEREATRLYEELRAGLTLDGQFATMVARFHRGFQRITEPNWVLTPEHLSRRFRAAFPASHRPAGTLLYGFAPQRSGGFVPMAGPGLETRGARILAELTGWITQPANTRPAPGQRLTKRFQAIFGTHIPLDLFAQERRGRLTPGLFFGREAIFLWDAITGARGQLLGAFLAVFPFDLVLGDIALHHALQEVHRQHPGMVPILIPQRGEERRRRVEFPPGYRPTRGLVRLAERIHRYRARDRLTLPAQVSGLLPGHWAIRFFPAPDVPYELWIFSRIPRGDAPETTAAMLLWVMIGGGLWLLPLVRSLTTASGFALSMRQWVMTCMVSLAVLALAAMRFSALYYLETSAARQAQERIDRILSALEELDTGVSSVFDHFARVCRRLVFSPRWVKDMLSNNPVAVSQGFRQAQTHLARQQPRLSLEYLLRYRGDTDLQGEVVVGDSDDRRTGEALLLVLRPFLQEGAARVGSAGADLPARPTTTGTMATDQKSPPARSGPFERGHPGRPSRSGDRGSVSVKAQPAADVMFSEFLRYTLDPAAFRLFLSYRQQADLMPTIRRPFLQFYDFVAAGGRFLGALVFLSDATIAYQRYLQIAMPRLGLAGEGWYAIGERTPDGCRLLHPGPGATRHGRTGRRLEQLMQVAARAGSTQEERTGDHALLAMPCVYAKGFVLGAAIPLDDLETWRNSRLRLLGLTLLGFLGLVLLLGRATASHLLDPLREVEHGLRRVAGGDLDLGVTLARDDELGDLSSAFDRLLQGLRERRDLGRFVSGEVEALVANRDHAAILRPQRRVATVLVADLREFTTLSERHPPTAIVAMLNRHHQEMVEGILAHGGSVELFIGDAVVAVFHDRDGEDGPRRAVAAAREMRRRHRRINEERQGKGQFIYEMGVGIDRGEVLIGTFGRAGKLEHTLLGPPRQRAEALEAASKQGKHTRIVVSPLVAQACPEVTFAPLASNALEIVAEEDR